MSYANQEARLTPRQAKFVNAIISGKSLSQAYEIAGYKPSDANASRLNGIDKVQSAIRQVQLKAAARAEATADSIARELDEIRILAIDDKQYAAAVAAALGKAKVLGLIVDRKEVEVRHAPAPFPTKTIELSEDEWKAQFALPRSLPGLLDAAIQADGIAPSSATSEVRPGAPLAGEETPAGRRARTAAKRKPSLTVRRG